VAQEVVLAQVVQVALEARVVQVVLPEHNPEAAVVVVALLIMEK
jgi:hypothetical protein